MSFPLTHRSWKVAWAATSVATRAATRAEIADFMAVDVCGEWCDAVEVDKQSRFEADPDNI